MVTCVALIHQRYPQLSRSFCLHGLSQYGSMLMWASVSDDMSVLGWYVSFHQSSIIDIVPIRLFFSILRKVNSIWISAHRYSHNE